MSQVRIYGCTQPTCHPDHRHGPRQRPGRGHSCLTRGCACPGTDWSSPTASGTTTEAVRPADSPFAHAAALVSTLHALLNEAVPRPTDGEHLRKLRLELHRLGVTCADLLGAIHESDDEGPA